MAHVAHVRFLRVQPPPRPTDAFSTWEGEQVYVFVSNHQITSVEGLIMANEGREGGDAVMENEDRQGNDVIMEKEEFPDEFQCCVCLDLMYKPVVLACGHISCFWCVYKAMDTSDHSHCPVCRNPYSHLPRVCEMMHRLLLNLYPEVYKRRAKQVAEEEKDRGHESQQFEENLKDSRVGGVFNAEDMSCPLSMAASVDFDSVLEENPCVQCSSERACSCEDNANAPQSTSAIQVADDKNSAKEDKDEDDTRKKLFTLLQCAVCEQLLFRPMVLNCGHVYCEACVQNPDDSVCRCPVCQSLHPNGFPSVCLVLHHFLEDYFPEEYAARKESSMSSQKASSSKGTLGRKDTSPTDVPLPWWSGRARLVHPGVGCDYCGMCPIIGERYRCKDCVEKIGFDLCEECHRSSSKLPGRFNQHHTPEHRFSVVPPLSMRDTILSTGEVGIIPEFNFYVVNSGEGRGAVSEVFATGGDEELDDPLHPDNNAAVDLVQFWRSSRQGAADDGDGGDDSGGDDIGGDSGGDDGREEQGGGRWIIDD